MLGETFRRCGQHQPVFGETFRRCGQYRWLIAILNAAALMDDDEHRFDPLITVLNANIEYLKKNVIRKGGIVWDDETDEELDEEDFDEEPDEETEGEKPQTDPTEE